MLHPLGTEARSYIQPTEPSNFETVLYKNEMWPEIYKYIPGTRSNRVFLFAYFSWYLLAQIIVVTENSFRKYYWVPQSYVFGTVMQMTNANTQKGGPCPNGLHPCFLTGSLQFLQIIWHLYKWCGLCRCIRETFFFNHCFLLWVHSQIQSLCSFVLLRAFMTCHHVTYCINYFDCRSSL